MTFYQCSMCLNNYTFDEFIKLQSVWIDPKKQQYGKTAICKCGMRFDYVWAIKSKKEDYIISTVHLMIGSISNSDFNDSSDNYFYETMIHDLVSDRYLPFQVRYKTKEEAIKGHKFTYDNLEKILLEPDKFPQGLIEIFCNAVNRTMDQKKTISQNVKRNLV